MATEGQEEPPAADLAVEQPQAEAPTEEVAGTATEEDAQPAQSEEGGQALEEGGQMLDEGGGEEGAEVAPAEGELGESGDVAPAAEEEAPAAAEPAQEEEEEDAAAKKKKKKKDCEVAVDHVKAMEYRIRKSGGTVYGTSAPTDAERLDALLNAAEQSGKRGSFQGFAGTPGGPAAVNYGVVKSSLDVDKERYERSLLSMQQTCSSLRASQERFCKSRPPVEDGAVFQDDEDWQGLIYGTGAGGGAGEDENRGVLSPRQEDEDEDDEEWQRLMEEEEAKEQELCKWFPSVRKSFESRKSVREESRKSRVETRKSRIAPEELLGLRQITDDWCRMACERVLGGQAAAFG